MRARGRITRDKVRVRSRVGRRVKGSQKSAREGDVLLEEGLLVLCVHLGRLAERLVLDKGHVGREHHERLCRLVGVLLGTLPLLPDPALLDEKPEVLVGLRRVG